MSDDLIDLAPLKRVDMRHRPKARYPITLQQGRNFIKMTEDQAIEVVQFILGLARAS